MPEPRGTTSELADRQQNAAAARHVAAADDAIGRLFKDHNEALLRFLRAKLHSPQEALEVAQEAYVQLLGLQDSSAIGYLQAYLFKTAENLANNRLKSGARRRELDGLALFEAEQAKSPEDDVAAQQEIALVNKALEELPVDMVRALVLVKFDGMNFEQAGRVMGTFGLRISRFVSRAISRLEKVLDTALKSEGSK